MLKLKPILSALLLLMSAAFCARADFSSYTNRIEQIADIGYINRDPVVSETGMVAWMGYKDGLVEDGGGSEIFIYKDGTTQKIFDRSLNPRAAHMRPQVWRDEVVWQSTRLENMTGAVTWILREVPDHLRDIGPDGKPLPELPAWFSSVDLRPEGSIADFNLTPDLQGKSGPFTNVFQYSVAYLEGRRPNSTNEIPAKVIDDLKKATAANSRMAPWFFDATNTARRKTIDYNELAHWTEATGVEWLTFDHRNDLGPSIDGELRAWQKAKAFPFGWEIMALDGEARYQLTTNFYYDMAPKVSGRNVTWYGWDGNDFEIFYWNADDQRVIQVTSNSWDDVSPAIHNGLIAWEAYPAVEAEIFAAWVEKEGKRLDTPEIIQLSSNIGDDLHPVVWDGKVAWQSFDGSDFEIWVWDFLRGPSGPDGKPRGEFIFQTNNNYDDVQPDMRDGILTWMGYMDEDADGEASWDAEIFMLDLSHPQIRQQESLRLTYNDYEDKNPRTAGGYVVWQAIDTDGAKIYLAKPEQASGASSGP